MNTAQVILKADGFQVTFESPTQKTQLSYKSPAKAAEAARKWRTEGVITPNN